MGPDTVPVSHGQVYGRVGRAFTQVTISCDSDNGETVYNGYHSHFTLTTTVEKKNWFLFHCAFLSFKAFLGCFSDFTGHSSNKEFLLLDRWFCEDMSELFARFR